MGLYILSKNALNRARRLKLGSISGANVEMHGIYLPKSEMVVGHAIHLLPLMNGSV
jgi:hypothetical protein